MNHMTTLSDGRPYDPARARIVLAILAGMAMMVTYVETMVLPAFKQFYTFFDQTGGSFSNVTWILSAYLLVGVVVTPVFGKLGDLYGKKRMLLLAMSIYAIAVTLAGFTPNIGSALGLSRPNQLYLLIGVRGVQGVGMGMFPIGFAMIPEVFPPARVGQAQGIISAMFATGASLGLVGGGWVAQTFGWQLTYHTVIPAAVLLVLLAFFLLRESALHPDRSVDVPGAASLGFALAMAMMGITEGASWGWGNLSAVTYSGVPLGVPQFFLLAALGTLFFVLWEPRAKNPVVSFAALRQRNLLVANVNGVIVGMLMFIVFTSITILIEFPYGPGFGQSELTMGLLALPASASMLVLGPILGRAVSTYGPKPVMLVGFATMALGGFLFVQFNRSLLEMAVMPIPLMAGNVAVLIAMVNTIVLTADRREVGAQTGMNQTFRTLGSAIAPVLVATILASFTATYLIPNPYTGGVVPFNGYALEGFQVVFALTGALAVVGFLLTLALRNYRFHADGSRSGHANAPAPPGTGSPASPREAWRPTAPHPEE